MVDTMSFSYQKDPANYFLPADIFPSIRYFVPKHYCSIRGQAASKGDGYEAERLLACAETASHRGFKKQSVTVKAGIASRDYTYVALWFDHVYFVRVAGGQTQRTATRYAHHVTLAYLPAVTELERKRMEEGLNELLSSWWWKTIAPGPMHLYVSVSFGECRCSVSVEKAASLISETKSLASRLGDLTYFFERLPVEPFSVVFFSAFSGKQTARIESIRGLSIAELNALSLGDLLATVFELTSMSR